MSDAHSESAAKQYSLTKLSNLLNNLLEKGANQSANDGSGCSILQVFTNLWIEEVERATVRSDQLVFKMLLKMLERLPKENFTLKLKVHNLHSLSRVEGWNANYTEAVDLLQQAIDLLESSPEASATFSPDELELLLARLRIDQARYFTNKRDWEKAEQLVKNNLPIVQKHHHTRTEATAHMVIGSIFYAQGNVEKGIEYNNKALELYQQIGDRISEARIYNNLASYLIILKQYKKALELIDKAIGIRTVLGNTKDLLETYGVASNIYYNLGHYQTALDYNHMATALSKQKNSPVSMIFHTNNLVIILCEMGEFKKAVPSAKESFETALTLNQPSQILLAGALLAKCTAAIGDRTTANMAVQEVQKHLDNKIDFNTIASEGTFYSHFGQALLYLAQDSDDYAEANECLNKSVEKFKKLNHLDYQFLVADVYAKILLERKIPGQNLSMEINAIIARMLRLWWDVLMAQPEKHNEQVLAKVWSYADWLTNAKLGQVYSVTPYEVYAFGLGELPKPHSQPEKLARGELLVKVAEVAPVAEKPVLLQTALTLLKEGHALLSRQKEVTRMLKAI